MKYDLVLSEEQSLLVVTVKKHQLNIQFIPFRWGGLNEWKGTVWQLQKNGANETCIITISIARNVKKGP